MEAYRKTRLVEILRRLRRRPFCFVLRRMRIVWRQADHHYDETGRSATITIASSRVRRNWADVLFMVMEGDVLVRVRHQNRHEPAMLVSESRFRELERLAAEGGSLRAVGEPPPPRTIHPDP